MRGGGLTLLSGAVVVAVAGRRFASTAPSSSLFSAVGAATETRPQVARATLREIAVSPRRLAMLARQIQGLSVAEAELQMTFSRKKIAKRVKDCVTLAKANAENNFGLDGSRLVICK